MARNIHVRLANTHSIYKEQGVDENGKQYDIHVTGFHPEDGGIAVNGQGQSLTPVVEVPRTSGVLGAIREGRLIDVRDDEEVEKVNAAIEAAYQERKRNSPPPTPTETVTISREEYDRLTTAGGSGSASSRARGRASDAGAGAGAES